MAGTREIVVRIVGDNSKLNKTLNDSESSLGKFGSTAAKVGGILAGGFVATQAVDFLVSSTKAAAEDAKQQQILANTLTNVTGATKAQIAATEQWITKTQFATGVSDSELRPALQNLVVSFGDIEQAQTQMTTAMDISVAKGIDLETVTKAMAKAHDGSAGALKKLGIETEDATGKTLTYDQIMQNAITTFGGSAQAAAETTAGKMKIMQEKFGELTEELGTALMPVMEAFVGFMLAHVVPALEQVIGIIQGMPTDLGDKIAAVLNAISRGFAGVINFLIDKANVVIGIINGLPGGDIITPLKHINANTYSLGPQSWLENASNAEKAAFGAYISGTNPAFVGPSRGEAGKFIGPQKPLGQSLDLGLTADDVDKLADAMGAPKLAGGGYVDRSGFAVVHKGEMVTAAGGMGGTFNIQNVNVTANSADEMVRSLNDYARRNGGLRVPGGVTAVS